LSNLHKLINFNKITKIKLFIYFYIQNIKNSIFNNSNKNIKINNYIFNLITYDNSFKNYEITLKNNFFNYFKEFKIKNNTLFYLHVVTINHLYKKTNKIDIYYTEFNFLKYILN
jgi:hypothetical protein